MRIAIADDHQDDRQELISLLDRYCQKNRLVVEYCFFSDAEALLADFSPQRYDLIFLDIYMTGMTGMAAAYRLREIDPDCRLVFFTTSSAFAVESYQVRAAYYLTKPLEYSRVEAAMDIACAELVQCSRSLTIHIKGVETTILMQDILYADCSRECARLHLDGQSLAVDEHIGNLLRELLLDERFLLCNRNVAVNMDAIVRATEGDFILKNGVGVPIRQRGRSAVRKEFLRYSLHSL